MESVELKRKIKKLKNLRGRRTELVTVMVPAGYELNRILNMLAQEQSTASNIKSKKTRLNVMTALEKIIQYLQLFKETPETGIAVFCGNIGDERDEWVIDAIIPPEPLNVKVYRCDQQFFLDPLEEMLKPKESYGLIVIERGGATIGILKGKRIDVVKTIKSMVPGKFRAGGQSAARFERVREGLAKDFYKNVAEAARKHLKDVKGILLGGPGPTKEEFYNILPNELKQKILAIKDIGYADEYGLKELVEKSKDVLAKTELMQEENLVEELFKRIAKGQPVAYGKDEVKNALLAGSVETLLISEEIPEEEVEELEQLAENSNVEIKYISADSEKGKEFLAIGGIGALLRY